MKKDVLKAIACLCCFCGCTDKEDEISSPEISQTWAIVQFTLDLEEEVLSFPTIKSIPDFEIPEPDISDQEDSGDLYNRIDYVVYSEEEPDVVYRHRQYTYEDEDFTIIYDSLPPGSYTLCFMAHSNKGMTVSEQTATFTKVTDTFHKSFAIELAGGQEVNQNVTLERIVSKIEFVATDAIYEELKSFTIDVSNYQNMINLVSGDGISEDISYSQTYPFKNSDIGEENTSHSFFTFVPTSSSLEAHLTTQDRLNEITREWYITDIEPIRNKILRYTGILYTPKTSEDTFMLEVLNEGEWGEIIDNILSEDY